MSFLLYTRRSTDEIGSQKNSLEYQEIECLQYAEKHNLQIAKDTEEGFMENGVIRERHSAFKSSNLSFSDDGMVGYSIERPKFMRLIQLLQEGKYEGFVVLCWDRISRNEQSDLIVKELINKHGINMRFVQTEYDVKTSSGQLHMDIDGMFARHHSRVTSEKVRTTFKKLRNEQKCTYFAPIGYLDEGSDNKTFDPERAPIIKRMFEQYATGEWSINDITKWANKQGLTTKPKRRRRSKEELLAGVEIEEKSSLPVNKSTTQIILTNPFYIGKLKYKDEVLEGKHPPLIDVETFNTVQRLLDDKCVTVKYMDKEFYTYRDLIRCSCGRAYSPYRKKGHVYYSSKCQEGCVNAKKNLSEDIVVEGIQQILDEIYFTDEELADIEAGAKEGLKKVASKRNSEIEDLNQRKRRVLKDLDYLKENRITLLREAAMTPEEWRSESEKLISELTEIDKLLEVQSHSEREMLDFVVNFSELFRTAAELYREALNTEKRRLAHLVFTELIFKDGKVASYKAKPEFEILLNRPRKTDIGMDQDNGSRGRVRTDGQFVNSELLYH